MILCIRADSPEVYIGIWDENTEKIGENWQAGRELSTQILSIIEANCDKVAIKLNDLNGIVVYEGPGSYTGLRISISTANALGYSYNFPIAGASGDDWIESGLRKLAKTKGFTPIQPVYGGEVYTTKPKK